MITLLDGGMGQELIARAGRATPLWSIAALIDDPAMVRAVHDDYFAAGADVATTNTYSVAPARLTSHDIADQLTTLSRIACTAAAQSRDAHGSGIVAGALGPLGFSFQPDLAPPIDAAAEVYANLARLHANFVDVHLLETMSSINEARGGLMGASVTGKPIWLALSVDDTDGTKLRSGEPLTDVLPLLKHFTPAAVLLNCSSPEAVTKGVPILQAAGIPVGAYANGFTAIAADFNKVGATVDALKTRTDLDPDTYADFAQLWVNAGATLIGGCCEVGPAHIQTLAARFK